MTLTFIKTPLKRLTFQAKPIKNWVVSRCEGKTLNLFSGLTNLGIGEYRVDINPEYAPDYVGDVYDFITSTEEIYDTIILDPPYSLRKSIELYNGNYTSKFKLIADKIPQILSSTGKVISFGYHTTFLGKKRGFELEEVCIFGHSGAQHATIAIVENKKT
jgi:hypothetical protein